MLQYLLNTTSIWLISLVLFDVFLRRESYHGYNRFYLLFTFLLGAFLPLLQWQDDGSPIYTSTFQRPLERVMAVKQTIVATTPGATTVNWEQWLSIIYLAGIMVAVCLLIIDIIKLASLYTIGTKSKQDGWVIIETGKGHAPFSLLNTLFVCSRKQYTGDEWNMILLHEQRHTKLFHSFDLLLMQLARVIFWFHPLVYIFNKRLLLVHEYQADNASAQQPQVYGHFLIEQAILSSAPSLSHSFNRSPIKNRIAMLTRRSSATSKIKMLLFIPLALVCIICFSQNSFSQKFIRNGNIVTYKGNRFEMSDPQVDTITLLDPVTGKEIVKMVKHDPYPVKMNGAKIFKDNETDAKPVFATGKDRLEKYIITSLQSATKNLPDGDYGLFMNNIVIDKNGSIAYYENGGLLSWQDDPTEVFGGKKQVILSTPDIMKAIDKMMDDMPKFNPAMDDISPVPYRQSALLIRKYLKVQNHVVRIVNVE